MRAVTGKPIKLLGVGEKLDGLEDFHPERVAGRILGMGDIVSLVEKAAETLDQAKAEKIAAKMKKGEFDLDDLGEQLKQMQKLGGMGGVLGMIPGIGKMKKQLEGANLDDKVLKRQSAIIGSMTKLERRNPKVLAASRKRRIAAGSGTSVQDVNKLLKMHRQMADMMKDMSRGKGGLAKMMGMGGGMPGMGAGGLPPGVTPQMLEAAKQGKLPGMPGGGGLAGLPGGMGGLPKGLGGLPGLPSPGGGFPGKKK
jgi:signal recognition particle subunit SRP54